MKENEDAQNAQEKAGKTSFGALVKDMEVTDREIATHDKGMRDLLQSVVVVGAVPIGEAADRSSLQDFPKVLLQNGQLHFKHGATANRSIFEVCDSRF